MPDTLPERPSVPTWSWRTNRLTFLLADDHLPREGAVIRAGSGEFYVDGDLFGYVVSVVYDVHVPITVVYHRERRDG